MGKVKKVTKRAAKPIHTEEKGTRDRELDVLIAERVLGYRVIGERKGAIKERTETGQVRPLRSYSTDMNAAWEVARKVGITLLPISDGTWFALVGKRKGWDSPAEFWQFIQAADFTSGGAAVSETAAKAVCLAALKAAVKIEVTQVANQIGAMENQAGADETVPTPTHGDLAAAPSDVRH